MYPGLAVALALGLAVVMPAVETSAADHAGHRQHDAHVHGSAQLNLAVDGENVFLELASPAMNIVGFEHQPSTTAQRSGVREGAAKLKALEVNLFTAFPGFEQIDAQIFTASGQTGAKISAGKNRVDL